jgi:hypothetical protein
MKDESTLSGTMSRLRSEGYTEDFNLRENCIECREGHYKMAPSEFKIDSFYRFEGETDPSDEAILYAISSDKFRLKGLLVNGYGLSSDPLTDDMIQKLKVH